MKIISLFLVALLVAGCNGLLKSAYGIKDPVNLSMQDVQNRAGKLGIPTESSFVLNPRYFNLLKGKDSIINFSNLCSPMITKYQQPLQALYFNQGGYLISMHTNCYAGGFPLLKWNNQGQFSSFVPKTTIPITDSVVRLNAMLPFLQPLDAVNKPQLGETTVVVFWSDFMFKQSRELIRVVKENLALSNGKASILYVNVDNAFIGSATTSPKMETKPFL